MFSSLWVNVCTAISGIQAQSIRADAVPGERITEHQQCCTGISPPFRTSRMTCLCKGAAQTAGWLQDGRCRKEGIPGRQAAADVPVGLP